MSRWLRQQSRPWKVLAVIGVLAAVVLCFVPLFDLIGYESAAFFGVLYGFTVSYLGFAELDWRGWMRGLRSRLALLVAPFAILTTNALVVQNCAYGIGVQFWVLIAGSSVVLATTLGWVVRNLVSRRRVGHAVIALVSIATLVDFAVRLAYQPPITGHHWFLGYFSGSIYDEALAVPASLVWYRVIHAAGIAAAVLLVTGWQERGRKVAALGVACAIVAGALFVQRQQFGIDLDRAYIEEALGGRVESEHFIIYYAAVPEFSVDLDRLVEDHEYRYAEMQAYFGTDPVALHGEKIESFVYANQDQKGELMGAPRTLVAKIWLREIHILWRRYGDHMLAHELAHVFTEPFGTGPLRLSTRFGLFPNMGLVEGVATAADWDADSLDPHRASAALRRLHKAPDITALVGASGFWTQSSGRAYTLMGSFVRWLVDQYGIEKFRRAYGHGDFARVYGKSANDLVAAWGKFVDGIELDDDEIELARYFYDRKSIFQKVCARTIAELRAQVSARARAHDARAARALMEQIVAFDPDNVGYRIEQATLFLSLGDNTAALDALKRLLDVELDPSQRTQVLALLGDALWRAGDPAAAAARYEECLGDALPIDAERFLLVKHFALQGDPAARPFAFHYLVDPTVAEDVRTFFPAEWARQHPDEPLADYLLGRRLWNARQFQWAEPYLRRALEVPAGPLRDEAYRMLVETLHFQGHDAQASAMLRTWKPTSRPYEATRNEWVRRVAWKARNTVDGGRR